ncbi:hypothetical protein HPB51_000712 [Rhipicephalus microplus]|uniref:Uncharacterized protein n=1 Tax=Rhipicephalus microplus TaxID=6941 RepID=A0A9J6D3T1_RHIMP|nr:hypothetical protein HPB51_000712 [Rhipicephalus microplus]
MISPHTYTPADNAGIVKRLRRAVVVQWLRYSAADPQVAGSNPSCSGCISDGGGNGVGSCGQIWEHVEEAQKKHPTALKEFDSKKRKAEHGPTVADKRHAGGSSTQTLESCLTATTSRPRALSQSRLDRVIVNFVICDMQCFSVVENEESWCFINALHPSATVAAKCTCEIFAELCRFVKFAKCSARGFLGVTVHYIDEESLERRSTALVYQRLTGHHTYDVIVTALHAVFVEYKILHKICIVIMDNGSNFVKAFRFSRISEDADLALAATVHSKFKLFWMTEARKAATIRLLEEERQALEAIFNENAAASEGTDEDDVFFQLPQSSLSCSEVQQWLSDPGTHIGELAKYPKINKIFIERNTRIPSSAPAEGLFSKRRDILSINRGSSLMKTLKSNSF